MNKYKIVGVDRISGEDESITIDAINRDLALESAYESGIVVSDIQLVKPAKTRPSKVRSEGSQSPTPFQAHWSARGGLRGSVNRIAENAVGVFIGLIAFSLVSPVVIAFVLMALAYLGKNLSASA